jgi:hypothetical protein
MHNNKGTFGVLLPVRCRNSGVSRGSCRHNYFRGPTPQVTSSVLSIPSYTFQHLVGLELVLVLAKRFQEGAE